MENLTVSQARVIIDEAVANFDGNLSDETISKIVFAMNENLQIRDYTIGLPINYGVEHMVQFFTYISDRIPSDEAYAVNTVLAMFEYELGETDIASHLIQSVNGTRVYSLALLATRVINAGWPSDSFVAMRNELSPKVIANIEELGDEVVGQKLDENELV